MRLKLLLVTLCMTSVPVARCASEGESIYKAQCVKCHGEKGDGKGHEHMKIKPADLRSETVQRKTDEELYNSIAFGVGHKEYAHGFAERGMSGKQIAEVVTYIRTFKSKQ